MLRRLAILCALGAALLAALAGQAAASPVAVDDASYSVLGRVFPDPLAGCKAVNAPVCSPTAQGNVPAHQFIQWEEFLAGISYLNKRHSRYMEVWTLDGKLDQLPARQANGGPADLLQAAPADPLANTPADVRPRAGTGLGPDRFPGNDLDFLEFTPKPEYRSAGLATPFLDRKKSDLIVVRVTDETVPDVNKKRYALSLSIHGIERAGLEGGTRAIEDLVSADATGLANQPVVPPSAKQGAPTFAESLDESIVYFTYPNPDGWRRGSYTEGGLFFQRYNGNGVDLNRDWPDIGFSFRPFSGLSEPESRALAAFFTQVRDRFGKFSAGADLHGQPFADALSYTLMPHGRHDYAKDVRIRETVKTINRASTAALSWSPLIGPAPSGCNGTALGTACTKIVGQTWGTVYDTINYTTTGALGDWFDSTVGLEADGINNEMSFSHLDKNITFDPHTEQLHVDGNKSLIYSQIAEMLTPTEAPFVATGTKSYVPNERMVREEKPTQPIPEGTSPQADIEGKPCTPDPSAGGATTCPFTVERDSDTYSGGMRVDVTVPNAQGVSSGMNSLEIQCKGCQLHHGKVYANPAAPDDQWVVVQQDFNQSPLYAQAGLTAAVNYPQANNTDGTPVQWRAVLNTRTAPILSGGICGTGCPPPGKHPVAHSPVATMSIDFTSGPATIDGGTEDVAEQPPTLAAYDVANTDFFSDLNPYISGKRNKFETVDPRRVLNGEQSLGGLDTLVLADNALPGEYAAAERAEWFAKVRSWVEGGGNLVLTDGALRALPELTNIPASAVAPRTVYVGQISFPSTSASVLNADPLTEGVAQPGARFNTGARRQTFEPTPLGFAIQNENGANTPYARQYSVTRTAWSAAGGRTSATSTSSAPAASADTTQTTLGELALGAGRIRIAGSLLPQPGTWPDGVTQPPPIMQTFPLGLEPYAVTYTGYLLMRNLLHDSTPADHNRPPVATLTHSPARVFTGETVALDASGSTDSDGTIENYAWDLDGDGTFETDTGTSPRTSTAFADDGVHTVAVKVTDDEGKTGLGVDAVTVENRPPSAAFTWSPATPKRKKPATFDASASRDPDGSIVRYVWDFDGNGTADSQSSRPTVSHSFADKGSYAVTLTVVDDDGASTSVTRTVRVSASG